MATVHVYPVNDPRGWGGGGVMALLAAATVIFGVCFFALMVWQCWVR